MSEHTHYRYAAKDGSYVTAWRPIPAEGIDRPGKVASKKLGDGYSMMLRKRVRKYKAAKKK